MSDCRYGACTNTGVHACELHLKSIHQLEPLFFVRQRSEGPSDLIIIELIIYIRLSTAILYISLKSTVFARVLIYTYHFTLTGYLNSVLRFLILSARFCLADFRFRRVRAVCIISFFLRHDWIFYVHFLDCAYVFCNSRIFSSTVPFAMNRMIFTGWFREYFKIFSIWLKNHVPSSAHTDVFSQLPGPQLQGSTMGQAEKQCWQTSGSTPVPPPLRRWEISRSEKSIYSWRRFHGVETAPSLVVSGQSLPTPSYVLGLTFGRRCEHSRSLPSSGTREQCPAR